MISKYWWTLSTSACFSYDLMWLSATQKQGPPSPNPLLLRHGLSLSLFICFRKKKDELIWKKWWEATSGQEDMEKNCDGGASRKPAKKDGKIETLLFERSNEMEYVATTTPCTTLISFLWSTYAAILHCLNISWII